MHNAALSDLVGRQPEYANWRYVRFEIDPEDLPDALELFHQSGFYGLNLTVPHKVEALELISDIDPEAAAMGAVNTLVREATGYRGFNSDGYGLRTAIYRELGVALRGVHVVLLGAGGAARAAAVQCLKDGCSSLWIGNRSPERLEGLIQHLVSIPGLDAAPRVRGFLFSELPNELPRRAVIIQASTAGMHEESEPFLSLEGFEPVSRFFDMVYKPAVTPMMKEAEQRGMKVANGLSMLVHQGVRSLEIWTQAPIDAGTMEAAAREAAAE